MTDQERDDLLLRMDRRLDGIDRRLDGIDRSLKQHGGALEALRKGQDAIRAVMVRDGAAQYHVNQNIEHRVSALEQTA